jgi:hypothetical protein
MWTALEHDAILQRISDLGDSPDGTPEQREMWALAERWRQEGVPDGALASLDEETSHRAVIILTALEWLRQRIDNDQHPGA